MRTRRGWSQFDTNEKLEALRADVMNALDMAEDQERRIKALETAMRSLASEVYALRQRS
jgi:hypothetical protein